ncbi:MAG TPA: aminopeptidase P N-terminal domain-containing protein [Candidatus Saccharimonadales bacterium]|nr:aminopeptidase P N-terminal domain-containing protein [Candidatus Saccharimonadales bacterium]
MFGSDFFAGNRARLRELFTGTAPIIITANGLLQRAADEAFPFQQDANFWYLTGIDEPDIVLVLDKGKEYLIVPGRSDTREVFDGAVDRAALARCSGIGDIVDETEGWHQLERRLKKAKHAATFAAGPAYVEPFGLYTNPARAVLIRRMKEANGALELLDLREHLARLRMVKQPVELAALQQAIRITTATLKEVTRPARLAKYTYEYEIEADITRGFRRRGARGHGFTPIVASGKRACTLHNVANEGRLASDELVVLDVGAEAEHYVADITRTCALGKDVSRRAQQVHAAVQDVQAYAFSLLKPGAGLREYEQQVEQFTGEKLRELGLIKTIEHEAVRRYFPHATSHFLGLNAHDAGDYAQSLEPGMVLTVEPGIYIPEEAIGVRIEDDVVITPEGNTILTDALPRTLL